jgi:hypothetical protein
MFSSGNGGDTEPQSGLSGVPTPRAEPSKTERSTRMCGIFEVMEKILMKMCESEKETIFVEMWTTVTGQKGDEDQIVFVCDAYEIHSELD